MWKKLAILLFFAFILRIFLINIAFHGDLYNNLSWGNALLKYGANGFFEQKVWEHSAPNQPPLYILLFGLTSFLFRNINGLILYLNDHVGIFPSSLVWFWQDNGNIILLKLPSIFADLGIGLIIYKFFENKSKNLAFKLSALWLFNPITFYNSAIWGQTDPIVNLLGLISIYFLINKRLILSLLFLTLSILFKGSLAIFVPVLFFYALWQKYDIKLWVKGILVSGIAIILISIWFYPSLDLPIWLINLYTKQILPGEIGDLSANAFNFWYLVNPGKVLDSMKYFDVAAHTWGYFFTLIVMAITVLKLKQKKNEKMLFYSLAIVAISSFLFMTRIHERYLYPFFPVATILIGYIPEFIILYIILSITFLINMYNLFWAPGVLIFENLLKTSQLSTILSVVNLAVFVAILTLFFIKKDDHKSHSA